MRSAEGLSIESEPTDEFTLSRQLRMQNHALSEQIEALKSAGGGGTSGGMEGRVAKLEAHVETLRADVRTMKKDVGDIRTGLATLTERVAHLPGKGFVVTATTTTIALLTGIILFGDKIQTLLALN